MSDIDDDDELWQLAVQNGIASNTRSAVQKRGAQARGNNAKLRMPQPSSLSKRPARMPKGVSAKKPLIHRKNSSKTTTSSPFLHQEQGTEGHGTLAVIPGETAKDGTTQPTPNLIHNSPPLINDNHNGGSNQTVSSITVEGSSTSPMSRISSFTPSRVDLSSQDPQGTQTPVVPLTLDIFPDTTGLSSCLPPALLTPTAQTSRAFDLDSDLEELWTPPRVLALSPEQTEATISGELTEMTSVFNPPLLLPDAFNGIAISSSVANANEQVANLSNTLESETSSSLSINFQANRRDKNIVPSPFTSPNHNYASQHNVVSSGGEQGGDREECNESSVSTSFGNNNSDHSPLQSPVTSPHSSSIIQEATSQGSSEQSGEDGQGLSGLTPTSRGRYSCEPSRRNPEKPRRIRAKRPDLHRQLRTSNQLLREQGEAYIGYRLVVDMDKGAAGGYKQIQDKPRPAKIMKPFCNSKVCKKIEGRFCWHLSDAQRQQMFQKFKKKTWKGKIQFIGSMVDVIAKKRMTVGADSPRRNTNRYFLKLQHKGPDGVIREKKVQVCVKTFVNTLGMSEHQMRNFLQKDVKSLAKNISKTLQPNPQRTARRGVIVSFLKDLRKMPSHYARAGSKKLYLEEKYKTQTEVYEEYKKHSEDKGVTPYSQCTFDIEFEKMNLSIHTPKKDECDTCKAFTDKNIGEDEYHAHIALKERARKEMKKDKQLAIEGKVHCIQMDVQAVKLCPVVFCKDNVFRTKLQIHNFTVYDLSNGDATCFLWDETEADMCASTFASCLWEYITTKFNDNLPVITYSDGCTSQNRNQYLANAFTHLSVKQKRVIIQKYLVKGHTHMECDNVHSCIERKLSFRPIYHPHDYIGICKEARRNDDTVMYLSHDFFKNFAAKGCRYYQSIQPKDRKVVDLKVIQYNPDAEIQYKLDYDEEYQKLPRRKHKNVSSQFPPLFEARRSISFRKYQDLKALVQHVPASMKDNLEQFYAAIPHQQQLQKEVTAAANGNGQSGADVQQEESFNSNESA